SSLAFVHHLVGHSESRSSRRATRCDHRVSVNDIRHLQSADGRRTSLHCFSMLRTCRKRAGDSVITLGLNTMNLRPLKSRVTLTPNVETLCHCQRKSAAACRGEDVTIVAR